jgi:hypothetical protein
MPRVQKHAYLAFEVRGKNLKPVNTNPVLHQFYYLLNELRFERGSMKIVVTDKDPAVLEQMDSSWVKGSIHLNMEVSLDHSTSAFILNELAKLKVEEGKIQINVIEATFSESRRSFPQVWPKEQIPIVGF